MSDLFGIEYFLGLVFDIDYFQQVALCFYHIHNSYGSSQSKTPGPGENGLSEDEGVEEEE